MIGRKSRHRTISLGIALLALGVMGAGGIVLAGDSGIELEGDEVRRAVLDPMQMKPAPELAEGDWIHGESATLESLEGKVVLLDFWGVWCGPCRALTPFIKELHDKYSEQGLVVIGVHTPQSAEEAPAYIKEQGIPYRVVVDLNRTTIDTYHVDSYPDIYLIDRAGNLRFADVANGDTENIESAVKLLLAEK